MAKTQRLLDRAYFLVEEDHLEDAARVLDVVIGDDPHNIEAWELYVQISDGHASLQALAERVRKNRDLTSSEKEEILVYQEYMLKHLEDDFAENRGSAGSRSALMLITAVFLLVIGLWIIVPEIRTMAAYYFLLAFIVGLGYWFWKSDRTSQYDGARSFTYQVSTPRLVETEKPELFFYEPIIKVGPAPDEYDES